MAAESWEGEARLCSSKAMCIMSMIRGVAFIRVVRPVAAPDVGGQRVRVRAL